MCAGRGEVPAAPGVTGCHQKLKYLAGFTHLCRNLASSRPSCCRISGLRAPLSPENCPSMLRCPGAATGDPKDLCMQSQRGATGLPACDSQTQLAHGRQRRRSSQPTESAAEKGCAFVRVPAGYAAQERDTSVEHLYEANWAEALSVSLQPCKTSSPTQVVSGGDLGTGPSSSLRLSCTSRLVHAKLRCRRC